MNDDAFGYLVIPRWVISFFVNKMITTLIVNIDVLLSLGGLVGGIAELIFHKESLPLNGKIVI